MVVNHSFLRAADFSVVNVDRALELVPFIREGNIHGAYKFLCDNSYLMTASLARRLIKLIEPLEIPGVSRKLFVITALCIRDEIQKHIVDISLLDQSLQWDIGHARVHSTICFFYFHIMKQLITTEGFHRLNHQFCAGYQQYSSTGSVAGLLIAIDAFQAEIRTNHQYVGLQYKLKEMRRIIQLTEQYPTLLSRPFYHLQRHLPDPTVNDYIRASYSSYYLIFVILSSCKIGIQQKLERTILNWPSTQLRSNRSTNLVRNAYSKLIASCNTVLPKLTGLLEGLAKYIPELQRIVFTTHNELSKGGYRQLDDYNSTCDELNVMSRIFNNWMIEEISRTTDNFNKILDLQRYVMGVNPHRVEERLQKIYSSQGLIAEIPNLLRQDWTKEAETLFVQNMRIDPNEFAWRKAITRMKNILSEHLTTLRGGFSLALANLDRLAYYRNTMVGRHLGHLTIKEFALLQTYDRVQLLENVWDVSDLVCCPLPKKESVSRVLLINEMTQAHIPFLEILAQVTNGELHREKILCLIQSLKAGQTETSLKSSLAQLTERHLHRALALDAHTDKKAWMSIERPVLKLESKAHVTPTSSISPPPVTPVLPLMVRSALIAWSEQMQNAAKKMKLNGVEAAVTNACAHAKGVVAVLKRIERLLPHAEMMKRDLFQAATLLVQEINLLIEQELLALSLKMEPARNASEVQDRLTHDLHVLFQKCSSGLSGFTHEDYIAILDADHTEIATRDIGFLDPKTQQFSSILMLLYQTNQWQLGRAPLDTWMPALMTYTGRILQSFGKLAYVFCSRSDWDQRAWDEAVNNLKMQISTSASTPPELRLEERIHVQIEEIEQCIRGLAKKDMSDQLQVSIRNLIENLIPRLKAELSWQSHLLQEEGYSHYSAVIGLNRSIAEQMLELRYYTCDRELPPHDGMLDVMARTLGCTHPDLLNWCKMKPRNLVRYPAENPKRHLSKTGARIAGTVRRALRTSEHETKEMAVPELEPGFTVVESQQLLAIKEAARKDLNQLHQLIKHLF